MAWTSCITMSVWWDSNFAHCRIAKKFDIFLSVTLFNSTVYANAFTIKAFEYGNSFDTVG